MKVALIDNYDSFTFNIKHYVEQFVDVCDVINIDDIKLEDIEPYDKIIFSPGPGLPKEKPILWQIIKHFQSSKPILGICFGHQAIAEYFGANLFNMPVVHHGLAKTVKVIDDDILWSKMPQTFKTGRYHSWAVEAKSLPDCLCITAIDSENNTIMAFKHRELNIRAVQFHPESILTENGIKIIENWINLC